MKSDRIIKLPVFRAMFTPVARKAWKCDICKERVTEGERYVHYIDRRINKIINYRFHRDCFKIVEAYCKTSKRTSFTPITVRKWAVKTCCDKCKEECPLHPCKRIMAKTTVILRKKRNFRKSSKES